MQMSTKKKKFCFYLQMSKNKEIVLFYSLFFFIGTVVFNVKQCYTNPDTIADNPDTIADNPYTYPDNPYT